MIAKLGFISATALTASLGLFAAAAAGSAEKPLTRDGAHRKNLLILPYLSRSGVTLPKPGTPQIGAQTTRERRAQRQMDAIIHSICSNC